MHEMCVHFFSIHNSKTTLHELKLGGKFISARTVSLEVKSCCYPACCANQHNITFILITKTIFMQLYKISPL